ncbi:MAG: TorD/DmsD family molecular chaperone [Nitrospirota bacterium]
MNKVFLANLYAQLSEFFKEPTEEFADDVASGRLLDYFKEVFSALDLDTSCLSGFLVSGDVYNILKDEYRRLFEGPLPPYIVPVESVYKRWSSDPECRLPMAGEKGYLMGDPAMDMIKRYQARDIVIPDKYSSMPDHIALEMEYMAFLCINGDIEEQMEFLGSHLNWIDELAKEIKNFEQGSKFYSAGAGITALIISRTQNTIENEPSGK